MKLLKNVLEKLEGVYISDETAKILEKQIGGKDKVNKPFKATTTDSTVETRDKLSIRQAEAKYVRPIIIRTRGDEVFDTIEARELADNVYEIIELVEQC